MLKQLLLLFFLIVGIPVLVTAQIPDSVRLQDSLQPMVVEDTVSKYDKALKGLLSENAFLNSSGKPVAMIVKLKTARSNDAFFYLLTGIVLLMGLIRVFFARYFSNLLRVFFNTSLRQSQLTDQLLQAKLPSLFFNMFFIISGGVYVYFILLQYKLIPQHQWMLLGACIVVLALIYLVKFSSLKFTGWITGYTEATDTYIFVIFLISKIIGILLIPFTIFIAFAELPIANTSALISLLIVGFLFLLRFFRSYGLIQNQLKVSRFHFFLYIAGVEIIPLLLIYKGLLFLLTKNQ